MSDFLMPEESAYDAPIHFRCHSLVDLMADSKTKADGILSKGAKTHVKNLVKEAVYGVRAKVDTKYMAKGLACEDGAIALLNDVLGTNFVKNKERRINQWLTGEPDIVADNFGIDIKCPWSVETFPLLPEDAYDSTYEWQARAYMMLFDKPWWDVAYCLMDTPEDLIRYEDPNVHFVSHIDARLRVTFARYERDAALEEKIKEKLTAAQALYTELLRTVRISRGVHDKPGVHPRLQKSAAQVAFQNL